MFMPDFARHQVENFLYAGWLSLSYSLVLSQDKEKKNASDLS